MHIVLLTEASRFAATIGADGTITPCSTEPERPAVVIGAKTVSVLLSALRGDAPLRTFLDDGRLSIAGSRRAVDATLPNLPRIAAVLLGGAAAGDAATAAAGEEGELEARSRLVLHCWHGDVEAADAWIRSAVAHVDDGLPSGTTPLLAAATAGQGDAVALLLRAGANPNVVLPGGRPALCAAAEGGWAHIIEALLLKGADISAGDPTHDGASALYVAAWRGHADAVGQLLAGGASADEPSPADGTTALYIASFGGHAGAVQTLIHYKASVDAPIADSTTPLWAAVQNSHALVARLLLAANANPNAARSDTGATPLMLACARDSNSIISALIDAGADHTAVARTDSPPEMPLKGVRACGWMLPSQRGVRRPPPKVARRSRK